MVSTVVLTLASLSACQILDQDQRGNDSSAARVEHIVAHRGASAERPECTLAAVRRAIEVGATAVEVDVRTSRDGKLFILHDATLDRTTNGQGPASERSLEELQRLDAGSSFSEEYRAERIPSLIEVAIECKGKIDLLLDLKEQGESYDRQVADVVREFGDPVATIVGVRSVAQAERFREWLPQSRQLGLIPTVDDIEDFANAGVEMIRLWPRWLENSDEPVKRIRAAGKQLHLNGTLGELEETRTLLEFGPESLLSDHPAKLLESLRRIANGDLPEAKLEPLIEVTERGLVRIGESSLGALTFLNRDYQMMEIPASIRGLPRYIFNGGDGSQVRLKFKQSAVVLAVFEYNDTGLWSFEGNLPPGDFGWHRLGDAMYRGSSNPEKEGAKHFAPIWYREYEPGQVLGGLPDWWLCLGVVDLDAARKLEGFQAGLTTDTAVPAPRYSHAKATANPRPLRVPTLGSAAEFHEWQTRQRQRFIDQLLIHYEGEVEVVLKQEAAHDSHTRREYRVTLDGSELFRFFRLAPLHHEAEEQRPTIVCFMGHGKVEQILDDEGSYQHACAKRYVKEGYLVYAMENIGMDPGEDSHLDLDQSLRLEGMGWYHVLFAHQRIMLEHVFADDSVDLDRVGTTGVSTGGLLALSAAVIESRVAATSVQGIFGSMRVSFIRDRHRHCKCGAIPGLLPDFDLPELALLVAPRPMHVSNGEADGFSPEEARRCIQLVGPWFEQAGGDIPELSVPRGGHAYAFEPALEFFKQHLK